MERGFSSLSLGGRDRERVAMGVLCMEAIFGF